MGRKARDPGPIEGDQDRRAAEVVRMAFFAHALIIRQEMGFFLERIFNQPTRDFTPGATKGGQTK
jgi:hypothetical protein